jgi:hypothetical protein
VVVDAAGLEYAKNKRPKAARAVAGARRPAEPM